MDKVLRHVQDIRPYLDAELLEDLKKILQRYVEDIETFEEALLYYFDSIPKPLRSAFIEEELLPACKQLPCLENWLSMIRLSFREYFRNFHMKNYDDTRMLGEVLLFGSVGCQRPLCYYNLEPPFCPCSRPLRPLVKIKEQ